MVLPPLGGREHRVAGHRPLQPPPFKGVPRPRAARAGRLGRGRVAQGKICLTESAICLFHKRKIGRLAVFSQNNMQIKCLHSVNSMSYPSKEIVGGAPSAAALCQHAFIKKHLQCLFNGGNADVRAFGGYLRFGERADTGLEQPSDPFRLGLP